MSGLPESGHGWTIYKSYALARWNAGPRHKR